VAVVDYSVSTVYEVTPDSIFQGLKITKQFLTARIVGFWNTHTHIAHISTVYPARNTMRSANDTSNYSITCVDLQVYSGRKMQLM